MSLRTGTELISLTLLINKLAGLYGLLAPLTGFHLSPLQLSMYVYSLGALAVAMLLVPHIRRGPQSPFHILALAWLYVIDSAVNAAYTAAFGFGWFLVLAQHAARSGSDGSSSGSGSVSTDAANAAGSKMMESAAGFTNPKYNVTHVDVHAEPADDTSMPAQNGELVGHGMDARDSPAAAAGAAGGGALSSTMLSSGSIASITTIVALWAIRVYFILVVLAYARSCLRQYIVTQSQHSTGFPATAATASTGDAATKPDSKDTTGPGSSSSDSDSDTQLYAEDPFALGTPEGAGYRGALGRVMVRFGKSYWLGVDNYEYDDEEQRKQDWARRLGGRFHERQQQRRQRVESGASGSGGGNSDAGPGAGVGERERRRRAGTGPPEPSSGGPWLRNVELGKMGGAK